MRVLIVQYAGDYREANQRFSQGGDENFYAQKHSVEVVAKLAQKVDEVATLCFMTEEPYNEVLENGVRAIGAGFQDQINKAKLIQIVESFKPTHLVLRTPNKPLLRWAIRHKVKTLPLLADSFPNQGLRNKTKNFFLTRLLNNPQIQWVSNCNIPASKTLSKIGVNPDKIVPWEWPAAKKPDEYKTKKAKPNTRDFQLFYAGQVMESKGIDDILGAVTKLKSKGIKTKLKVAGQGDLEQYKTKCKRLGVSDRVTFLGLIPNSQVFKLMREADSVIVPSHPEYPEGFPKTVMETLCSRTPLIASDHPVFDNILEHEQNALMFPAANTDALANRIERLRTDADLYHHLSVASARAWQKLQLPVKWADMLESWLFDSPQNRQWLYQHRLSARGL
jgi:glycosyltransferase involved in cell wall biosynthesis